MVVSIVDDIEAPRVRERVIVAERPAPIVVVATPHVEVARVEAPRLEPPPAEPRRPAQRDPELAAYRLAYDAHFHGGSPAAALAAWDAYLAAYPDGKLAIDARYNRAIMLVKLSARATPPPRYAHSRAHSRAEAARLLNALPH